MLRVNNLLYLKSDSTVCSFEVSQKYRKKIFSFFFHVINYFTCFSILKAAVGCSCHLESQEERWLMEIAISSFFLFPSSLPTNRKTHNPGPSSVFSFVLVISNESGSTLRWMHLVAFMQGWIHHRSTSQCINLILWQCPHYLPPSSVSSFSRQFSHAKNLIEYSISTVHHDKWNSAWTYAPKENYL